METVERDFAVQKRDGSLQEFDPKKLGRSITSSAHVLPVRGADINAVVDRIEKRLLPESLNGPVPSTRIGELVIEELRGLGDAADLARIRFAMVFLGCSSGPGTLSNAAEFLEWMEHNYPGSESGGFVDGLQPVLVLKRDGRRTEHFDEAKVERSIAVALQGRGRPAEIGRMARVLAQEVVETLDGQPLVSSLQIGSEVLKLLRAADGLAYLRFGATFKRITSPEFIALDARSVLAVEFKGVSHPAKSGHG